MSRRVLHSRGQKGSKVAVEVRLDGDGHPVGNCRLRWPSAGGYVTAALDFQPLPKDGGPYDSDTVPDLEGFLQEWSEDALDRVREAARDKAKALDYEDDQDGPTTTGEPFDGRVDTLFREFLEDKLLDSEADPDQGPNDRTLSEYRDTANLLIWYLRDHLGVPKAADVRTQHVKKFKGDRRTGRIARDPVRTEDGVTTGKGGKYVRKADDRREVSNRTVKKGVRLWKEAWEWATTKIDGQGEPYLERNLLRNVSMPSTKNPSRVPKDRLSNFRRAYYWPILQVSDQISTRFYRGDSLAVEDRSYLREMVAVAYHYGRRINSIRKLRLQDVEDALEGGKLLHWRADADKMGKRWKTPVARGARPALEMMLARHREPLVHPSGAELSLDGDVAPEDAWLFPAPGDPAKPVSYETCKAWLDKAEELAGVEPLTDKLWHAFRAAFATRFLHAGHVPQTIATIGGWKSVETIMRIYAGGDLEAEDDLAMGRPPRYSRRHSWNGAS